MKIVQYNEDFVLKLFYVVDTLHKTIIPTKICSTNVGAKKKLSDSELITIALLFSFYGNPAFKRFYEVFDFRKYFSSVPEYSRLLRNIKGAMPQALLLLNLILKLNQQHAIDKVKLIDSMPLPVVANKRIFHYASSDLADRGKGSMGWFYGFKVHLITDTDGNILKMKLTPGNVSDKDQEIVASLATDIKGIVVGDTGYYSQPLITKLATMGIRLVTGCTKRTKKLVDQSYHTLRKMRQMIETVNGCIKFRRGCASSLPRSNDGYFFRYIAAILNYSMMKAFF